MSWESRWGPLRAKRQAIAKEPTPVYLPPPIYTPSVRLEPYAPRLAVRAAAAPPPAPRPPPEPVWVVLATYNRLGPLREALGTVRERAGLRCHFVVVDGGSSDGTRRWLVDQPDVTFIGQRGPLTGAVLAFNLGFSFAVERGFPYIMHFNDDAELITDGALADAMARLERDDQLGEVAFEQNFRGAWGFEQIHGKTYANFGLVRRAAGIAVAVAQGDPTGRHWWNTIYRSYAADSEFGCWLHRLGWGLDLGVSLRINDLQVQDELRALNESDNPDRPDSKLFWSRWPDRAAIEKPQQGSPQ